MASAAITPMMAMTIKSSTSEKPCSLLILVSLEACNASISTLSREIIGTCESNVRAIGFQAKRSN
jgi:hypothetical protein